MSTATANESLIAALGDRRYRIERHWAKLPEG